ncbi:MAG: hypothetical protein ABEK16_00095 [Candidatus Nanohalobium sp.]
MNLDKLKEKKERNKEQRKEFIKLWAEYVRNHPDEEWSRQQNKIINSQLESARESSEV